jgi:hypothetical protein
MRCSEYGADGPQRAGDLCPHVDFATLDIHATEEGNVRTPDKRHQPNVMFHHYGNLFEEHRATYNTSSYRRSKLDGTCDDTCWIHGGENTGFIQYKNKQTTRMG